MEHSQKSQPEKVRTISHFCHIDYPKSATALLRPADLQRHYAYCAMY
jgi:hypothetical protein